jgi:hypothetical protein
MSLTPVGARQCNAQARIDASGRDFADGTRRDLLRASGVARLLHGLHRPRAKLAVAERSAFLSTTQSQISTDQPQISTACCWRVVEGRRDEE